MTEFDEFDAWPPERPGRRSDPSICRSVHGAYHALERRLQIATSEHGLGTSEAMVLAYLLRQPGCAAAVVRHALGLHRSTLSSLLDRLERRGLVLRAHSSFDGRRHEIHLTPRGISLQRSPRTSFGMSKPSSQSSPRPASGAAPSLCSLRASPSRVRAVSSTSDWSPHYSEIGVRIRMIELDGSDFQRRAKSDDRPARSGRGPEPLSRRGSGFPGPASLPPRPTRRGPTRKRGGCRG